MTAIFTWIRDNPLAFKSFLTTFFALAIKFVLQVGGQAGQLEHWNTAVNQLIDLVVYALSAYGVIAGAVHTSRGPALPAADQTATIVAAIQEPPAAKP